jgi:hypothetical protein
VRQEQQHRLGRRNLLLQQVDVLRALCVQEHLQRDRALLDCAVAMGCATAAVPCRASSPGTRFLSSSKSDLHWSAPSAW